MTDDLHLPEQTDPWAGLRLSGAPAAHYEPGDLVEITLPGTDIAHGTWTVEAPAGDGWVHVSLRDGDDPSLVLRSCRAKVTHLRHVCIVEPDRDGPTLWDCSCVECLQLQRLAP